MRRAALSIVSTVVGLVLLLSFKSHSLGTPATPAAAVSGSTSNTTTSDGSTSGTGSGNSSSKTKATKTTATKTVTGDAADTQYGPVQVAITVKDGTITKVDAVEYPTTDPRDAQINSYAIPVLDREALAAGNASIDMVSGATFTSQGYLTSLQSAVDKAGLS